MTPTPPIPPSPPAPAGRLAGVGRAVDGWLTRPEPNAAGRLGLFRILYASFYL